MGLNPVKTKKPEDFGLPCPAIHKTLNMIGFEILRPVLEQPYHGRFILVKKQA